MNISEWSTAMNMSSLGDLTQREDATPTRGARRKSETRRRLLRAARSVFAREGLENTTIAQITGAADVGFGTFYLHFVTKEEAYRAVVADGFDELARLLNQARAEALERDAPWWELVQVAVRVYCHFAERNRELFLVMFTGGQAGIGLGRELQEQFAEALAAHLSETRAHASERAQPAPYPYPTQPVALASVVALSRSALWWLAHDTHDAHDMHDLQDSRDGGEQSASHLTLDALIETMTRYLTAALWGQTPTA
jgi:AcrR family transcriptional regulator